MAIPSLLALFLQEPLTPVAPVVPAPQMPNFAVAPAAVEATRIALTPVLDGRLEEEEWDPFATEGSGKTYLQWEPGGLHLAAHVGPGYEIVASFDLANDGWLKGKDNLELRIAPDGSVKARIVDATPTSGPVWIDIPGFQLSTKVVAGPETIEASIMDPGLGLLPEKTGSKIGVRVDLVPIGSAVMEAYMPRVATPVSLAFYRAAGLPTGLKFEPENESKSVVPGQTVRLRFTYSGKNDMGLQRLNLRSEGPARMATSLIEVPFPTFDRKNRAFVDYDTPVASGASLGYRIARGSLTGADGIPSVMQVSYRIADPADAQLVLDRIPVAETDRSMKRNYYLRSNSGRPVNGKMKIELPAPLRILNGNDRNVPLGTSRSRIRQGFELFVPGGASGTFPVTFRFNIEGREYVQTQYLTVG
ncbi:hypothetical protein EON81_02420 [bacterium]|nr:MAG: hypothetical protein EON81_02420 [bacterium]